MHVNSRHFALGQSQAEAIPGVSEKIGPKVTNSFTALKDLFDNMRKGGADALFITGDLIDFNQNFNPLKLDQSGTKAQWAQYDLSKQFKSGVALDPQLYPRGLDDMLAYSLFKYSYLHDCPVFVITGNHEAYDVPYGIAPRLNDRGIAQTYQQTVELRKLMQDRETRAQALDDEAEKLDKAHHPEEARAKRDQAQAIRNERVAGEPVAPERLTKSNSVLGTDPAQRASSLEPVAEKARNAGRSIERFFGGDGKGDSPLQDTLKWIKQKTDVDAQNPYEYSGNYANEGVAADHNLTIYEACMAYGPSYSQLVKAWNFTPANFDWFFMMFTPLANFRVHYGSTQCFVGLDWGETEIMINADMKPGEINKTYEQGKKADSDHPYKAALKALGDNLIGLPRSDKSISRGQQVLLEAALAQSTGKNVLFTHFTLINFDQPVSYAKVSTPFALDDDTFNEYTKGSFGERRGWLLGKVVNGGLHYSMSGHSHRAGVYKLNNRNPQAATAAAYEPALVGDASMDGIHKKLFSDPQTTRLIVSSCGGPIGVQNVGGEMNHWNLRPPAGTLLKTDASGPDECRRVVATGSQSKPRFCVALDYMFVLAGEPGVSWVPLWDDKISHSSASARPSGEGVFYLIPPVLQDYVPFIEGVEFFVWGGGRQKKFGSHKTTLTIEPQSDGRVYRNQFVDWKVFSDAVDGSKDAPVFVQVSFNKNLAARLMYQHYSFEDAWIFQVVVDGNRIARPNGETGEVPRFKWLKNSIEKLSYAALPT